MHSSPDQQNLIRPRAVVATIPTLKALEIGLSLPAGAVDFFEIRVDSLLRSELDPEERASAKAQIAELKAPLIITVRHPEEGGEGQLELEQRRALFREFFAMASLVDIEIRSALQLVDIIGETIRTGVGLIFSYHDFQATPSLGRLFELRQHALDLGASTLKVAAMAQSPHDLSVLLQFLTESVESGVGTQGQPLTYAVMGMGPYGRISRLALGRAGSVLNYGYLDGAQVPGQWPATLLKERLAEL